MAVASAASSAAAERAPGMVATAGATFSDGTAAEPVAPVGCPITWAACACASVTVAVAASLAAAASSALAASASVCALPTAASAAVDEGGGGGLSVA
eukprot:scaffold303139_cov31-Tisochrysis_lutea.AAC.1